MSTASSSDVQEVDPATAAKKKQLKLLRMHCFFTQFVSQLNYSTRIEILRDLCGGKVATQHGM
jgi:hypothetical protein